MGERPALRYGLGLTCRSSSTTPAGHEIDRQAADAAATPPISPATGCGWRCPSAARPVPTASKCSTKTATCSPMTSSSARPRYQCTGAMPRASQLNGYSLAP
ncbi:MAG: hypothetical protein WKG07_21595 [Hymenobacter sp.]